MAHDLGAARVEAGDDRAVVVQLAGVAVGRRDRHRADTGFKTMALRDAPCVQAEYRERYDVRPMQRDQAVYRTHKFDAGPAVGELVAHDFWNRQSGHRGFKCELHTLGEADAKCQTVVKQRFAFAVRRAPELRHNSGIRAQRRQALEQRRRGVAGCVQSHRHRHEFVRDGLVGCEREYIGDLHRKTAR